MRKILIADDHGLYRRGLQIALSADIPDCTIFEAHHLEGALAILSTESPVDLAILDLYMPGLDNLSMLAEILPDYPDTRFAIISGSPSRASILATLSAGLHGFIAKSQTNEEIVQAINEIMDGCIYLPSLLSKTLGPPSPVPPSPDSEPAPDRPRATGIGNLRSLTQRQRDVLKLMAEGYSNKEISRNLQIAEATTKTHAAALMRALGVRNRTEAAVLLKNWISRTSV